MTPPTNSDLASAGSDDPAGRRACDQCRLRKIRCDKDWPCSNCRVSKRSCTSTGVGQRPKEPRQRVLISSQYERKIDQIEARLGGIESLLQNISSSSSGNGGDNGSTTRRSHTPQTGGSSSAPTAASLADLDSSDNESVYGGDSGLAAQTAFASEFLEHAVQRTSLRDVNSNIESALSNLRQLVDMQQHRSISHGPRFPLQKPIPQGGLSQLPMPPMATVVPLLKSAKHAPPNLFTFTVNLVGLTDISSLCRMVYFPADDFSQANFIIVNSLLYNLFLEQYALAPRDSSAGDEYLEYAQMTQSNLETGLANLPLFLSPKIENVQALVLGVLYAIDVSRPSVAWHLSSMSAQLCQTGGFHRMECLNSDPPKIAQVKNILFWQTYTLDKALSLRIGRTSVIRDFDINIPRSFDFKGIVHLDGSPFTQLWLKTSAIQGRIYDELYSPAALAATPAELAQRALSLAIDCKNHEEEYNKAREETAAYLKSLNSSSAIDVFLKGDEVQFQVTLTLVYRAIPAPEGSVSKFCVECLESARRAILLHQEAIEMVQLGRYDTSIHIHWNLLITPFAPFFVMFCYIIETSSQEDLALVKEFVACLRTYHDASETIDKLYRLFQVMLDVAVVYVEAKSQQQQDQTMIPIGDEFDMYLSQLGFMPADGQAMEHGDPAAPSHTMAQANPMADWFSGSRNMFGLLEEDLSQIDPSRWMPTDQL